MDWACWRFAARTPRASCRAAFGRRGETRHRRIDARGPAQPAGSRDRPARPASRAGPEEVLAVLPRELMGAVEPRLRKYILRAKVRIEDLSGTLRVVGIPAGAICTGICSFAGAIAGCCWYPVGLPKSGPSRLPRMGTRRHRRRLAAGIYRDQRSLRRPDAQPRLARRHRLRQGLLHRPGSHRARALSRPRKTPVAALARRGRRGAFPGDSVRSADGRSLTVVRAAPGAEGGWDLLAVGPFAAATATESICATRPAR